MPGWPEYNNRKHSQEADFQRIIQLLEEISSKLGSPNLSCNTIPASGACSLCGLTFDGMTTYHCARRDCPISTTSFLA